MENKRTILVILVATVLALGLTVYGEQLETSNLKEKKVVERSTLDNYENIEEKLRN